MVCTVIPFDLELKKDMKLWELVDAYDLFIHFGIINYFNRIENNDGKCGLPDLGTMKNWSVRSTNKGLYATHPENLKKACEPHL